MTHVRVESIRFRVMCFRKRCRSDAAYLVASSDGRREFSCGHHLGGSVASGITRMNVAIAIAEAS